MSFPIYFGSGRVGIGQPNPTKDLDISGDVAISGALTVAGSSVVGISVGSVGAVPNAAGASLSGGVLTLQPADGTHPGVITSGTQTIGGAKTFSSTIAASNLSGTNTGDVTLAAVGSSPSANGASLSGQALTLQPADLTHPGLVNLSAQTLGDGAKSFNSSVLPVTSGSQALGSTSKVWNKIYANTHADNADIGRLDVQGGSYNVYKDAQASVSANGWSHLFQTNGAVASGAWLAIWQNNGTSKFRITGFGSPDIADYTAKAVGNQTSNTVAGRGGIANGTSTATITNSVVKGTSIVKVQLETAAAGVANIIVTTTGTGSFVVTSVNGTGVATNTTADATFSWIVFNGN